MHTRWIKVILDLWTHRARTFIVALAIAVGVYAVGVVLDAREMLVREYEKDKSSAHIASAVVYTTPFDDDLAKRIARLPGVAGAEGRSQVRVRVAPGPGQTGGPRDLVLVALPEFEQMSVDAVAPLAGTWPPPRRQVTLERLAFDYLGTAIGQDITVELDNGAVRTLRVAGSAHEQQQFGPDISGVAYGYISRETLRELGLPTDYTELRLRVTEPAHDEAHILAVLDTVENHLKDAGHPVLSRTVRTQSPADPFIDTVVLILTSFGLIILLLSGFLVVNAISALVTQQIPHIGVMKLIGARRLQIAGMYLVTVLVYGVLAVSVAIPLALLTARLLMVLMVDPLLNVMVESYAVPLPLLAVQAAVGLLLPLLAGLFPVLRGTAITTQRALSDVGLATAEYGHGLVERLLAQLQRLRSIGRPVLLAIRNTLRHKGRLVQTLIVLVLGTALFISVLSVRVSVNATLDNFMRFHRYDVSVEMERPERIQRLEQAAREVPGVVDVQVWSVDRALRLRSDDSKSDPVALYAVPRGTDWMAPQVTSGQWLPAASGSVSNPIVVNSDLVDNEKDVHVGSVLKLEIAGRKATWQVVGIVPTESRGPALYAAADDYQYATRTSGQGTEVQVRSAHHDAASQHALATALLEHLEARGMPVTDTETTQVMRSENDLMFTIVVAFLILMALLLAAVGGLGLATTMSINIMERVREIGVLRAIGASNASVRQIVVAEGVAMGIVSWIAGTLLSLLLSPLFSNILGIALIKVPLTYQYSVAAAIAWFFILQLVAVVASLGPARNAVKLTVREVLAYE
jgi:putative ABC transport system permease protein